MESLWRWIRAQKQERVTSGEIDRVQQELAKAVGMSAGMLSDLLGDNPPKTSRFIEKLCKHCDIALPWFADKIEEALVADLKLLRARRGADWEWLRSGIERMASEARAQPDHRPDTDAD